MDVKIDGGVDMWGWMDLFEDEWMNGWIDRWIDLDIDEWIARWIDVKVERVTGA